MKIGKEFDGCHNASSVPLFWYFVSLFALGRNLVDGGVLVATVVAVKPTVAGIVVGHASAGISTGSKLEALTKLGVALSAAELVRFTTATAYGGKCDDDHLHDGCEAKCMWQGVWKKQSMGLKCTYSGIYLLQTLHSFLQFSRKYDLYDVFRVQNDLFVSEQNRLGSGPSLQSPSSMKR